MEKANFYSRELVSERVKFALIPAFAGTSLFVLPVVRNSFCLPRIYFGVSRQKEGIEHYRNNTIFFT
jgi:hypothetical protein